MSPYFGNTPDFLCSSTAKKKPPVSCKCGRIRILSCIVRQDIRVHSRETNVPSVQAKVFRWWPMTPRETRSPLSTRKRRDILFVAFKELQFSADGRVPVSQTRAPNEGWKRFRYVDQLES